jgi:hypothetical protein
VTERGKLEDIEDSVGWAAIDCWTAGVPVRHRNEALVDVNVQGAHGRHR